MNAKKINHREIEPSKYVIFLKKASDFHRIMEASFKERNWHATGLGAVHCSISSADALLAKKKGIKSTSKDHMDVVSLIKSEIQVKECGEYTTTLEKILKCKNAIEYLDRLFTEKEAEDIMKRAVRFYEWVLKQTEK